MYCFALRTAAKYSVRRKLEVTFSGARFFDFTHGGVVFRAKAAGAFGENIVDDPQAVLHVIECDEAVIEHQHCVIEADFIAKALGEALDEPHHVVAKIADGAGDQRRQSGKPHGTETLDALAQERNGVALFPNDAVAALHDAGAVGVAEDFLGVRARKRVARDLFAALDTFEQEGVSRALGDSQIGADRSQQISGKNVIDRDEVALFGEALEFAEVRLDHGSRFTVPTESPRCSGRGGIFDQQFSAHEKRDPLLHYFGWTRIIRQGPRYFGRSRPSSSGRTMPQLGEYPPPRVFHKCCI